MEDSLEVRTRLRELLLRIARLAIVGEAASPAAAIAGIRAIKPNVVLLDLSLEGGNGFEVLKEIHPEAPEIAFIVMTNNDSAAYAKRAAELGAVHYFDKSLQQDEIIRTVESMAR